MKNWMLFHQLGLQEDMTVYVAVKWCGYTETIKEEKNNKKVYGKWRLGSRLLWGGGGKKENT